MCGARIERVEADAFTIPTDAPEADGTIDWQATTIIVVQAYAGEVSGLGYSYADSSAIGLIHRVLVPELDGLDAFDVERAYGQMTRAVRNIGRPGVAAGAVSAVDIALWDLKARLLDVPLIGLLGATRDDIPVYGSGGFTSYSIERLCDQLEGWAAAGFRAVKMKVGRDRVADRKRVHESRKAIGPDVELFVDANGAYDRKTALDQARAFAQCDVVWFEEPVPADDLEGLRLLRDRMPAPIEVAAGEYGYTPTDFRRMLEAGAVDVLQADATRCGGITGFLRAAALADAFGLPLSAHTAPNVHTHPCCAAPRVRHLEYFHDHARIEPMLFDGVLHPVDGTLRPDRSRPGLGLTLKALDAQRYAVAGT